MDKGAVYTSTTRAPDPNDYDDHGEYCDAYDEWEIQQDYNDTHDQWSCADQFRSDQGL